MDERARVALDAESKRFLTTEFGHSEPFETSELASLKIIALSGATELAWILRCTALKRLAAHRSSDVCWSDTSSALNVLPRFRGLDLSFSAVPSLECVRAHGALRDVFVMDTLISDARPLSTVSRLRAASLIGCPLTEESYLEIVPQLRAMPSNPTVKVSPEADWRLTLVIYGRGIRASYSQGKVIAPGLAYSKLPDLHSWAVTHDDVKRVLDQVEDGDLKGFMDCCRDIAHGK